MDPVTRQQPDEGQRRQKLQIVGGLDYAGHDAALKSDGARPDVGEEDRAPFPSRIAGEDRRAPETAFGKAVREVMAEAKPDEDGIVSISLVGILDRAVAKMRAAAYDSSANS
ncbi:hypothetical protein [Amorphus sp. MBR-141]